MHRMHFINSHFEKPKPYMEFGEGPDGIWRVEQVTINNIKYSIPNPHDKEYWENLGVKI